MAENGTTQGADMRQGLGVQAGIAINEQAGRVEAVKGALELALAECADDLRVNHTHALFIFRAVMQELGSIQGSISQLEVDYCRNRQEVTA